MKRFAAVTLAALMLLTVFASAAIAEESVEIRGPVYNGTTLSSIIQQPNGINMNSTNFAAFYYDLNNDVATESLKIIKASTTSSNVIEKQGLEYSTVITDTDYKYKPWGNYSVLGFFADKFIPLKDKPEKLAQLITDNKDKKTLKTGDKLDLGKGYTLEAKQVDVDGKKVWLEFANNGTFIDDKIISTDSATERSWECQLDKILGEDDVPVMKVHVDSVFQGAVDSICSIDGLWLVDYQKAKEIKSDAEFGKLNNVNIQSKGINITNDDTFTLTKDSDQEIGQGLYFRIAKDSNALRFYAFKKITEPGTYEIRGEIATGDKTWTPTNFAGFFYDLKNDIGTESLKVSNVDTVNRKIPKNNLEYKTTIKYVDFKHDWAGKQYPVLGFFAKKYIPLKSKPEKLALLVTDNDDKKTLKTGEKLDLGEGYTLEAKQVDVDGKKVWLEFAKNGTFIDDKIISTDVATDRTWDCELDKIMGEDDVLVLKVNVDSVFQGAVDSIATIKGLWLIDYQEPNAMEIKSDDEFNKLNNVNIGTSDITIMNDDAFSLTKDSVQVIGKDMKFRIADDSKLRYYPFVEKTIGGETTTTETETGTETKTPSANMTETPSANMTETPSANMTETSATTSTEGKTPVANNTSTEKKGTPGFEIIPGILGLLAVVYFVRRNR